MNKTRVYVEESAVATKYYAQIQKSFLGIKYWECFDFLGSSLESKAITNTVKKLDEKGVEHKENTRTTAEALCLEYQNLQQALKKKKEDKRKHKKTKKVWSYLFPEDV